MPTYSGVTIAQLDDLASPDNNDLLVINDVSSGNTKKITRENFLFSADTDPVARNLYDSGTGIIIEGPTYVADDTIINGDLEVENEIIAGGDISTSGNISFGSLTDYVNNITAIRLINSSSDITTYDSSLPTSLAVRDYVTSSISASGFSRQTFFGETGIIAGNDSVDINISCYKGYALYRMECDSAAWIRLYTDSAARDADVGRNINTTASDSSGLVAEFKTTGARTINLSNPILGYNNSTPAFDVIPMKIVNRKAFTSPNIIVELTLLKTEI